MSGTALISVEDSTSTVGTRMAVKGTNGMAQVVPPSEMPASAALSIIRDLTTTRQKISLPSGALWAVLSYRLLPGATAVTNQFARFVINAASDADADGRLATDGAFFAIAQGDDVLMSAGSASAITRIDVIASAAVGVEKTIFTVSAGVQ